MLNNKLIFSSKNYRYASFFVFLSCIFPLSSCANSAELQKNNERLSQYELDIITKQDLTDGENLIQEPSEYISCCILYFRHIEMLSVLKKDFSRRVNVDLNDYFINIKENEGSYFIYLGERYLENEQIFARGKWQPFLGDADVPVYSYEIEKASLKIIEFKEEYK